MVRWKRKTTDLQEKKSRIPIRLEPARAKKIRRKNSGEVKKKFKK